MEQPKIASASLALRTLRQAGYKSTASAIAELVDNSIEAEAEDVYILAASKKVSIRGKKTSRVQHLGVLDNGTGMKPEVLQNCLSLGWGTRLESRKGLGRFGFGLKGSAISQAKLVQVYSWQKGEQPLMTYLDLDAIFENETELVPKVCKKNLPDEVLKTCGDFIGESGTLVWWSDLDGVDFKRTQTLVKRLRQGLCRVFRHFLDDDDRLGKRSNIYVCDVNLDDNEVNKIPLHANDPIYLLKPNNLPGYENKATNELLDTIKFTAKNGEREGEVEILVTVAYPSVQKLGGLSDQGKHYAENTGISFVRAGREIDLGLFGYVARSEPRHRWWGIEVRFPPELDELFGVTNNKQSVRKIKKLDIDQKQALEEDIDDGASSEQADALRFRLRLNHILEEQVTKVTNQVQGRGVGSRTKKAEAEEDVAAINKNLKSTDDRSPTLSEQKASDLSEVEKCHEVTELLKKTDTSLTDEEAQEMAEQRVGEYKIDIQTDDWPGDLVLDRRSAGGCAFGVINRRSAFYEAFYRYYEQSKDQKGFTALRVLLMAMIRAEDKMVEAGHEKSLNKFRQAWGQHVNDFLEEVLQ